MRHRWLAAVALAACTAGSARAQQVTDSTFTPHVEHPAFTARHPVVLIDEGHANPYLSRGRGRPFATLAAADGLQVMPSPQPFSAPLLEHVNVLVVFDAVNNIGNRITMGASAFTEEEIKAVTNWVEGGGSLLLVAEQAPFSTGATRLVHALGATIGDRPVIDFSHADPDAGNPACLVFSREQGLLGTHPIMSGRDSSEAVRRVATWTGVAVSGPPGAAALLKLADTAREVADGDTVRPAGPAQAVAFRRSHGRVVLMGDAAALGAQLAVGEGAGRDGHPLSMGINRSDLDNQQFALNVMRWLGGAIDPPPPSAPPTHGPPKPRATPQRSRTSVRTAARAPASTRTK